MIIVVTLIGKFKLYIMAYCIMGIHEIAHLIAAKCIGLKPDTMTFSPFGLNLKLNNKIISSLTDEIILYSVGPLINAIFALIALVIGIPDLYKLNIVFFVINILPVIPLDGGMIAVRLLSYKLGRKQAKRIINSFSVIMCVVLLVIDIWFICRGQINISIFVMAVFFIGNILTSKEMYDTDLINALSGSKKTTNKIKAVIINEVYGITDAIKEISPAYSLIAVKLDDYGKVEKILTEKEILNNIDI